MWAWTKRMLQKHKGLVLYGIFGVLTTLINFVCYEALYELRGWPNVPSNIVAWVVAVLFAFVTNKLWVFQSKSLNPSVLLPELWKFAGCRLATGLMDLAIMYVGVDLLQGPSMPWKLGSNVLVILLNYIFSKLLIFRHKEEA